MTVYELQHLFYRDEGVICPSPKTLGVFPSVESAQNAISYFLTQPGFRENPDAFSLRERTVSAPAEPDTLYEALVYLHTPDYDFEHTIELGLYGSKLSADAAVSSYCERNPLLSNADGLVLEAVTNRITIGKPEWTEGFTF